MRGQLEAQSEEGFCRFMETLLPGVDGILGVRLPALRKMARQLAKGDWETYLLRARDKSYEEIMLQGLVIGYAEGDFSRKEGYLRRFVPKIDNWAVCDSVCAAVKLAKGQPEEMWGFLRECLGSGREYAMRFALVQMLDYYVDQEHLPRVLEAVDRVDSGFYYVRMARAWAVSACCAEFPEETLDYLGRCHLDDFSFRMAIRKITESRKVAAEWKDAARRLRKDREMRFKEVNEGGSC